MSARLQQSLREWNPTIRQSEIKDENNGNSFMLFTLFMVTTGPIMIAIVQAIHQEWMNRPYKEYGFDLLR